MKKFVRPLISIIIPTYNVVATLQRAIDSVGGQLFDGLELIVIDGASTDGTLEIIHSNEYTISKWISEVDKGNYDAINKGVRQATGEWIYILGADDYLWSPTVMALMAPYLIEFAGKCGVVYGKVAYVNVHGEILNELGDPWELARLNFYDRMTLSHQAVFHHRSLFDRHGMFDETFRMAGDYEFLLRELKSGHAIFVPNIIIAGYQHGGGSTLPKHALRVLLEFRRAQKLNGFRWPSPHWLVCFSRTFLRMLFWHLLGEKRAARLDDCIRQFVGLPRIWTRV